jgi:hypothetical protein
MKFHPYPGSPERYALRLKSNALFHPALARQTNVPSSADDSMPRHSASLLQSPNNLTRCAGESGRLRHCAVGRNLTAWNFSSRGPQFFEHPL